MSDKRAEPDVSVDPARVNSRVSDDSQAPDDEADGMTTAPGPTGEFVGRIAGDDLGYAGETGAERRAEAEPEFDQTDSTYSRETESGTATP